MFEEFPELRDHLAIEVLAEAFRARSPERTPPVSVEVLAAIAGIADISVSDRISGSAMLVESLAGTKAVVLNRNDTRVRRRFSLAHEIAHLVLHPDRAAHEFNEPIAERRGRSTVERACDFFAACLLVPRDLLNAEVGRARDARQLARRFDVSEATMRARLREIGYHELAHIERGL